MSKEAVRSDHAQDMLSVSKEAQAGGSEAEGPLWACRGHLSRKRGRPDWEGGLRLRVRGGADRRGEKGRGILCQELWIFPPHFHVTFIFFISGTRTH